LRRKKPRGARGKHKGDKNMNNMKNEISNRLGSIEKVEGIQILFACESGSRAWGFASPDSDFDIRFIYKRTIEAYLSIKEIPDTIEYPIQDNLDFNGWDLKKFLFHLHKSNGVMMEWLQSPIIYLDTDNFRTSFLNTMSDYFNARSTINHYLGLTKRTLLDFSDATDVKLKKYFYILRPILAARWIRQKKTVPPMDFESLLSSTNLNESVMSMILDLKKRKEISIESQLIPRLINLESFVKEEIFCCESTLPEDNQKVKDIIELNAFFKRIVLGK
jgi:predicted nucleotidyltransferase